MSNRPTTKQALARHRSWSILRLTSARETIKSLVRDVPGAETAIIVCDNEINRLRKELHNDRVN